MNVRVFPLRRNGRRVERAEPADGVAGDLRMYSLVHGSDGAAYVQEWRCLLE